MSVIAGGDGTGRIAFANIDVPSGNTINNTTTETTFTSSATLPPEMWFIGRTFELNVFGLFNTALVVPSITGKIKLGSIIIGTTGSITTVGSLTNSQWSGTLFISVITIGSSGTIEVQGNIRIQTTVNSEIVLPIVNTSVITFDMTTNQTLTLTAQWGAASTSNTITLRQFILKG